MHKKFSKCIGVKTKHVTSKLRKMGGKKEGIKRMKCGRTLEHTLYLARIRRRG